MLPVGGTDAMGIWGYLNAWQEMMQQVCTELLFAHEHFILVCFTWYHWRVYLTSSQTLWLLQGVVEHLYHWLLETTSQVHVWSEYLRIDFLQVYIFLNKWQKFICWLKKVGSEIFLPWFNLRKASESLQRQHKC